MIVVVFRAWRWVGVIIFNGDVDGIRSHVVHLYGIAFGLNDAYTYFDVVLDRRVVRVVFDREFVWTFEVVPIYYAFSGRPFRSVGLGSLGRNGLVYLVGNLPFFELGDLVSVDGIKAWDQVSVFIFGADHEED